MYTAAQIAQATGAPLANVQTSWPNLVAALDWQHINTHATRVALVATVAVETSVTENGRNMTFLPVQELGGASAWYAPWYGRGFIQCTLEDNYRAYGPRLQPPIDLIANPDAMLQQIPSAQFAALYFVDKAINVLAAQGNWTAIRVRVNGGNGVDREDGGTTNGLNSFLNYVRALVAIPEAPDASPVTTVAVSSPLQQHPAIAADPALDAHHKPVPPLPVGTVVHFQKDPHTGQETTPHWACVGLGNGVWGWYPRAYLITSGG